AGEFNLLVAAGRDLFQRAFEIFSHLGAHRVELHADAAKLLRRRFAFYPVQGGQGDGSNYTLTRGGQESPSVDHKSCLQCWGFENRISTARGTDLARRRTI